MTVTPDGRASVQAGAGIVADSDPASENAECAHKAAALLSAVAMARDRRAGGRGHDRRRAAAGGYAEALRTRRRRPGWWDATC